MIEGVKFVVWLYNQSQPNSLGNSGITLPNVKRMIFSKTVNLLAEAVLSKLRPLRNLSPLINI